MNDYLQGTVNGSAASPGAQAVSQIIRMESWAAMILLAAGLIFLLFGIRLIRPICTVLLGGAGFYAGMGYLLLTGAEGNADKLPAVAIIGFTAGLLLGYLFYRFWLMLGLGVKNNIVVFACF